MMTCPHTGLPIFLRKRPNDSPGVEWYDHQYSVVIDGVVVGCIGKTFALANGDTWQWGISMMLQPGRADVNGSCDSLETAKARWLEKWQQVNPELERERRCQDEYRAQKRGWDRHHGQGEFAGCPRFTAEYFSLGRWAKTATFIAMDGTDALGFATGHICHEFADEIRLLDEHRQEIIRMLVKPRRPVGRHTPPPMH